MSVTHNNNLGFVRLLAAWLVLFNHSFTLCNGVEGTDPITVAISTFSPFGLTIGSNAVNVFFLISGFLVTSSYLSRDNLVDFLLARVLRIYPALFAAVTFCVFIVGAGVAQLSFKEYIANDLTWSYWFDNIILIKGIQFNLPSVFIDLPYSGAINGSLWSLRYEVYLYILTAILGLFTILKNKTVFNIVISILCIALILAQYKHIYTFHINYVFSAVFSFVVGMFFSVNKQKVAFNWKGSLLLLIVSVLVSRTALYDYVALILLGYLTLWLSLGAKRKWLDVERFGDFSYGVYLYAMPLQQLAIYWFGVNIVLNILFTSVFALLLAVLSWFYIEKPCLDLKKQYKTR